MGPETKTMNEKYVLIPRGLLETCIHTLKMIHPTDFDGMDRLVAVVALLMKAEVEGRQEATMPAPVQGEQTEDEK